MHNVRLRRRIDDFLIAPRENLRRAMKATRAGDAGRLFLGLGFCWGVLGGLELYRAAVIRRPGPQRMVFRRESDGRK